jgi:hypothetical protein
MTGMGLRVLSHGHNTHVESLYFPTARFTFKVCEMSKLRYAFEEERERYFPIIVATPGLSFRKAAHHVASMLQKVQIGERRFHLRHEVRNRVKDINTQTFTAHHESQPDLERSFERASYVGRWR